MKYFSEMFNISYFSLDSFKPCSTMWRICSPSEAAEARISDQFSRFSGFDSANRENGSGRPDSEQTERQPGENPRAVLGETTV